MQRVGLHQHPFKFNCLQQPAQGLDLATGIGGVGGLGNRHTQRLGIEAHLSDETRCAGVVLSDRAPQRLAVTHKGVELFIHTQLGRHPVAQQGFKTSHIQLGQQQPEGGIRGRLSEIGAQQFVERLPVAFGKSLHAHQRALAAQDREDRHQQHPPLRKANAAAHPAIRQRLEKTDQIACSSWRGGGLGGQGSGAVPAQNTVGAGPRPALLGQTSKSLLKNPAISAKMGQLPS